MDVQKIIKTLSPAQRGALKYAGYNRVGDNHYVEEDYSVRRSTIEVLIKKELLVRGVNRHWLSDSGDAVRDELRAT